MCLDKFIFVTINMTFMATLFCLLKNHILNHNTDGYWTKFNFLPPTKNRLAYAEYNISMIFGILYMSGGFKSKISKRCCVIFFHQYIFGFLLILLPWVLW